MARSTRCGELRDAEIVGFRTAVGGSPCQRDRSRSRRRRDPESSARVMPNRQRIACVGSTSRARQQHEPRAAMNREDRLAVVESGDGIHLGAIEQVSPQRRRAGIAGDSPDGKTRPMRPPGAPVAARARRTTDTGWRGPMFHAIDAGFADEVSETPRLGPARRSARPPRRCRRGPCPMADCRSPRRTPTLRRMALRRRGRPPETTSGQ